MSVPEELVWLIAQLRGTASRRERIRLLARGWRTLRDLSPADRLAVAHELGFDGAESLVEQLSRRGGTSPSAVLELLERAEEAGPDQIVTMVQSLTDPEGRRSLGERVLNVAKHWVADLEPWEDPAERAVDVDPTPTVVSPDESHGGGAAEVDVPASLRSPVPPMIDQGTDDGVNDVKLTEFPEPIVEGDVTDRSPTHQPGGVADIEAATDPEFGAGDIAPDSEHTGRPQVTQVAEAQPEPEPSGEPPEVPPPARVKAPPVQMIMDVDGVVRRLDGCPTVIRRLKELTGLARELTDADGVGFSSVLDRFPDGWARRRAVESLFRAGVPPNLDTALSLTAALSDGAQRMWALSTLVSTRDLTSDEMEAVLSLATSPVLRRRLARLGAVNPMVGVEE